MTTVEPGASEVFTQGIALEPELDRPLGEQAGADHHRGVRGVGAARDRRDHDPAVIELDLGAVLERDHDAGVVGAGGRSVAGAAVAARGLPAAPEWSSAGGSEAGKDCSTASS